MSLAKQQFVSYSQEADDYIAWQLLGKADNGLIVEVGAFDGIHLSNSFALESLGWRSICVEGNPKTFEYLRRNRPKASCISCAVVENEDIEEVEFTTETIGVLSGISIDVDDVERRYKNRGVEFDRPNKIRVPARTLNNILRAEDIKPSAIDVISIDVEGYELNVLKGLDLNFYSPALLIIEANNNDEHARLLQYFEQYPRYIYLGSNWHNMFFILKERLRSRTLRNLDFKNYIMAKQHHPFDQRLAIQSVKPKFIHDKKNLEAYRNRLMSFFYKKK